MKVNCETKQDENIKPGPEEDNRQHLISIMGENNADIAVGCDIDADRIFAFDADGRWITGNELFAIFSNTLCAKKICASLDTSSNPEPELPLVPDVPSVPSLP